LRKTPKEEKTKEALQQPSSNSSQPPNKLRRSTKVVSFSGSHSSSVNHFSPSIKPSQACVAQAVIHCSDGLPYHAFTYVHGTSPEATDKADQAPRHRPLLSLSSVTLPRVLSPTASFFSPSPCILTARHV